MDSPPYQAHSGAGVVKEGMGEAEWGGKGRVGWSGLGQEGVRRVSRAGQGQTACGQSEDAVAVAVAVVVAATWWGGVPMVWQWR